MQSFIALAATALATLANSAPANWVYNGQIGPNDYLPAVPYAGYPNYGVPSTTGYPSNSGYDTGGYYANNDKVYYPNGFIINGQRYPPGWYTPWIYREKHNNLNTL